MDNIINFLTSAAKLIVAIGLAYVAALWFALIVWTYRDIETRSRSVVTQIFATLLVVLFFVPGAILYFVLRPRDTLDEAFQRSLEEEYLLQDLEDLPRCHKCHRTIESDWIICPACHEELRHECPNCAHLVRVTWDICPYCATELEPAAAIEDESSSIGRLTAMIRDRFGDRMGGEGKPGEPVYPAAVPQGAGMVLYGARPGAQSQQYTQPGPQIPAAGRMGGNVTIAPIVPFPGVDSAPPGQGGPHGSENRPNGMGAPPRTEHFNAAHHGGGSDPYNNADVPLDFDDLQPLRAGAPTGNSAGNGNGKGSAAAGNGHFANGPAPNGHIASANGSNGFHPNGNGAGPNPLGTGAAPGFGPTPQRASGSEQGTRAGEPVGPPAAPVRRP